MGTQSTSSATITVRPRGGPSFSTRSAGRAAPAGGPRAPRPEDQLDHAAAGPGGRVDDHGPSWSTPTGPGVDGPVGEAGADLGGLGVAVQDGVAHLVDRAGADRVVGGVADDLPPGLVAAAPRPALGGQEQRRQRLGARRSRRARRGGRLLHVDPVGRHAHQQVGPGARAQLAGPRGQAVGGRRRRARPASRCAARRSSEVVGLGHHPPQPRLGHEVVGAVHPEDRAREQVALLLLELVTGRTSALASSGRARRCRSPAAGTRPAPWSRRGRHQKPLRSTAEGTPRHTTACSNPNSRRSCGIWATWPNMSGR